MSLPQEQTLNDVDGRYLRQAIALADKARERGNRPFGALIVAADGRVLKTHIGPFANQAAIANWVQPWETRGLR